MAAHAPLRRREQSSFTAASHMRLNAPTERAADTDRSVLAERRADQNEQSTRPWQGKVRASDTRVQCRTHSRNHQHRGATVGLISSVGSAPSRPYLSDRRSSRSAIPVLTSSTARRPSWCTKVGEGLPLPQTARQARHRRRPPALGSGGRRPTPAAAVPHALAYCRCGDRSRFGGGHRPSQPVPPSPPPPASPPTGAVPPARVAACRWRPLRPRWQPRHPPSASPSLDKPLYTKQKWPTRVGPGEHRRFARAPPSTPQPFAHRSVAATAVSLPTSRGDSCLDCNLIVSSRVELAATTFWPSIADGLCIARCCARVFLHRRGPPPPPPTTSRPRSPLAARFACRWACATLPRWCFFPPPHLLAALSPPRRLLRPLSGAVPPPPSRCRDALLPRRAAAGGARAPPRCLFLPHCLHLCPPRAPIHGDHGVDGGGAIVAVVGSGGRLLPRRRRRRGRRGGGARRGWWGGKGAFPAGGGARGGGGRHGGGGGRQGAQGWRLRGAGQGGPRHVAARSGGQLGRRVGRAQIRAAGGGGDAHVGRRDGVAAAERLWGARGGGYSRAERRRVGRGVSRRAAGGGAGHEDGYFCEGRSTATWSAPRAWAKGALFAIGAVPLPSGLCDVAALLCLLRCLLVVALGSER